MCCTRYRMQKSPFLHYRTNFIRLCLRSWGMYRQSEKNLLNSNTSSTCPDNMVNFGLLTAEICWRVWGIPANFNGFHGLAALLHGTLVVGVSQTLRRWTEGVTYIRQGGHHVGHWPTFLFFILCLLMYCMFSHKDSSSTSTLGLAVCGGQPGQGSPKGSNHWKNWG